MKSNRLLFWLFVILVFSLVNSVSVANPQANVFEYEILEPSNIETYKVKQVWWQEHKILVKWWLSSCIIIVYILVEWFYFKKNRVIIELNKQSDLEPFRWNINIPSSYAILHSDNFGVLPDKLQNRRVNNKKGIDVKSTVIATAKSAGLMDLKFKSTEKPAYYLILIDQQSRKNHQWALFEFISSELIKQDLRVKKFYFNKRLSSCWEESSLQKYTLKDLQSHYIDHRLIVFADADNFSAVDKESINELNLLKQWDEATFMTAKDSLLWGENEKFIESFMPVLPANLNGIELLTERYETLDVSLLYNNSKNKESWIIDLKEEPELVIANLQYYLLPHVNQTLSTEKANLLTWIAACCIFPQVYWDLTFLIGNKLSTPDNNLLTIENISRLTKLSWFQEGRIPEKYRECLLNNSEIITDKQKQMIADTIAHLLEDNMKNLSNQSVFHSHKMQLLICQIIGNSSESTKKTKIKELKSIFPFALQKDFLVYSILKDGKKFLLEIIIPDKWHKTFFNDQFSFTGFKFTYRLLIACLLLIFPLSLKMDRIICANPIKYDDSYYCIIDNYQMAKLLNLAAVESYEPNSLEIEYTLEVLDSAMQTISGFNIGMENKVKVFYNITIFHLQNGNKEKARITFEKLKSLPRNFVISNEKMIKLKEAL
ncbi:hypothetical protein [Chondrinema litorale]|uniref:hypothetical protein n=1 Tax=Chondrinema litorale TaxID=2994555 RepID=UPI002542C88F|nr:hypothetical protein [Chondrinema litorale]UZR98237.1 hypothetical protein OQ292_30865 [Chondrinema litorale]